jgi:hypothetical protein
MLHTSCAVTLAAAAAPLLVSKAVKTPGEAAEAIAGVLHFCGTCFAHEYYTRFAGCCCCCCCCCCCFRAFAGLDAGAEVSASPVMGKGFPVEAIPADAHPTVLLFATGEQTAGSYIIVGY